MRNQHDMTLDQGCEIACTDDDFPHALGCVFIDQWGGTVLRIDDDPGAYSGESDRRL
jgi:hypothetical protein